MTRQKNGLVADLDRVIADKKIGNRAAMLRRVADLFVVSSGRLSDDQIALFDDVMVHLLEEIEASARATFGHLLATLPDAPPNATRKLALDDAIDVAGPILSHSERVDDSTLIEGARTKSQAHLLAISRRKRIAETVTDILVERGDENVVMSTAQNPGATFSEFGYSTLVQRSSTNDDLAACIWSRPEIPRQHLLKLFSDASESVKQKLTTKDPRKAGIILEIVAQATQQIQTCAREKSDGYAAAYNQVMRLHEAGILGEHELAAYARERKFDETAITLSLIGDLPIDLVERMFVDERSEHIVVIAKALDLSWDTLKAILALKGNGNGTSTHEMDIALEAFMRLKKGTAKKAVQFYRLRERARIALPLQMKNATSRISYGSGASATR